MNNTMLAMAVKQFTLTTQKMTEADLERSWGWHDYTTEGLRFAFLRTYEELRELAVKLRQERAALGKPSTSAQLILAHYHAAYLDLQAALIGLEPELINQAPAEGEWPVQKTVAHILSADLGFYVAVKYALDWQRSGNFLPPEIPESAWPAILGLNEAAYHALLDSAFENLQNQHSLWHARIMRELAEITEAEIDLPSTYWEKEALSVRFRLHRFDSHLRQHTLQIDKTLSQLGRSPTEARRLLRLVFAAQAEVEGALIGAEEIGQAGQRQFAQTLIERVIEIAKSLA